MQVLNGDPGSDGIGTPPPHVFLDAHQDDRFPQTEGLDGPSTQPVLRPPGERSEPFGLVAGERPDSRTASLSDYPAASVPENWPGGKGEAFEPVLPERPTRLTGPVQFVLKLLEHWHLNSGDAVSLLGFDRSDADYVHSLLAGRERLRGQDVRDRIFHLYEIRKSLRFLFRDLETENAWLRESHPPLDDETPMALLLSGSMESLLVVKDYVDTFAGK